MKRKVIRSVSLCLLILWMCAIYNFSAQPADISDNTSGGIVEKVAIAVYPNYDKLDDAGKLNAISLLSGAIRKSAHMFEFAVLGALIFIFVSTFEKISASGALMISLSGGLRYAVHDEVHQIFIAGRACGFIDVMIDFSGVLFAAVICYLIALRVKRCKT